MDVFITLLLDLTTVIHIYTPHNYRFMNNSPLEYWAHMHTYTHTRGIGRIFIEGFLTGRALRAKIFETTPTLWPRLLINALATIYRQVVGLNDRKKTSKSCRFMIPEHREWQNKTSPVSVHHYQYIYKHWFLRPGGFLGSYFHLSKFVKLFSHTNVHGLAVPLIKWLILTNWGMNSI